MSATMPLNSTRSVSPRLPIGMTTAAAGGATPMPTVATTAMRNTNQRRMPSLPFAASHLGTPVARRGDDRRSGRPGAHAADFLDADPGQQSRRGVGRREVLA